MGESGYKAVYVAICKAAVTTGARAGELIAAEWGDLDLTNGKLRILSRLLDKARTKAGIPDVGEHGRERNPFHAFRACFARLCREAASTRNGCRHSSATPTRG